MKPTLAVVGAGKVGTTLARLLYARGYRIETIYSRSYSHAVDLANQIDARAVESPAEVTGDLALLTVPDDAIEATAASLAGFSGQAVIHTSGAKDVSVLASLAGHGMMLGSLHPAYPFADVKSAMAGLPGSAFAVEASDEPLLGWLHEIVESLRGQVLVIPPGGKPLYHAALMIASNYTVALYALAESLLLRLGADKATTDSALNALLAATVENLQAEGVPNALTGPLVRADIGTIEEHLQALGAVDEQIAGIYRYLARLTYPLLAARGIATDEIEHLLQQDIEDAHHSS